MKYMGSKNRIAKHILPIILKDRKPDQWYVEPFVGGFNLIDKVDGNRIANDSNKYLIELFKAIQEGWVPPTDITEQEYTDIRINKDKYPAHFVGFVGFGCSYAGKWFGGYARGNQANGSPINYCGESKKNILKQAKNIQNIQIFNKSYLELEIPDNSIIYCDPPYLNTTKYKDSFNHGGFYNWCRNKKQEGHTIFVSEYQMPCDFRCVWEMKINNTLVADTGSKQGTERLFIL